jgi:HD-GYP domain-containing protein (c-di-GMP phosphodiesterase class II)
VQARVEEYAPRGQATKALPPRPVAAWPLQTSLSWQIDISIARGEVLRLPEQDTPFLARIADLGAVSFDRQLAGEMVQQFDASAQQLRDVFHALDQSRRADVAALPALAEKALVHATEDFDLFVSLGMVGPSSEYPQRQSLHSCMLAMGVAANLGYDQSTIVELGLGCLIHDVGMLRTKGGLHAENHVLSNQEFEDVASHPIYTFDLLAAHLDTVPVASRLIAYQIHERCDGSGYPRRRQTATIHPLARIAAVADVFVALISPRAYRPAMMPYYAMEHLVRGAAHGVFDLEVVRGLLTTVSLFPLGSHVMLNDGRVGKVLRSNRAAYNRPILQVPGSSATSPGGEIVDLNQPDCELHVVRAVPSPAAA